MSKEIKIYSDPMVELFGSKYDYIAKATEYEREIRDLLKDEKIDLDEFREGMSIYSFYEKVREIRMAAEDHNGMLYIVAVCTVSDDLSDSETRDLMGFLQFEYLSAWGERVGKNPICTVIKREMMDMWDDNGDRFTRECDEEYDVFISFWHTRLLMGTLDEMEAWRVKFAL